MTAQGHLVQEGAEGAPSMVLVHGMEDSWASWRPLVAALGGRWRVTAMDLPWRASNGYAWRQDGSAGDWLARGLAALDRSPDVLVGHSFGGNAVLEVLACADTPPAGAGVLIAPNYRPPDWTVTWHMFDASRRLFDEVIREGMVQRMGRRAAETAPDVLESMLGKMVDRLGPMRFLALFDGFVSSADLPLEKVDVPTLVLAGTDDPTVSGGRAQLLAERLGRGRSVLDDTLPHLAHHARPETVARHLLGFLAEVRPDLAGAAQVAR